MKKKQWKRMVNKVSFVGESFTRKPPKFERFVRPAALRFKKAHVTHPELKATFQLDLIGVKKNPQSPLYTSLGVNCRSSSKSKSLIAVPHSRKRWSGAPYVWNCPGRLCEDPRASPMPGAERARGPRPEPRRKAQCGRNMRRIAGKRRPRRPRLDRKSVV